MLNRLAQGTCLAALLAATLPAGAAEPLDAANRLKALLAKQGYTMSWQSIDGDSSEATLKGVVTTMPGGDGASQAPIAVGNLIMSEIEDGDNGAITVGSFQLPAYSVETDGTAISVTGVEMLNLVLPAEGVTNPLESSGLFDSFTIEGVTATRGGKEVFSMEGFNYDLVLSDDRNALSFTTAAESFTADLTGTADPQSLAMLTALGLTKPTGSFEGSGDFSMTTGVANLDQWDFTIDKAGTLGMTFSIGGYTPEVMKAFQDIQNSMANATEEQKQAQGMAVLGLMQQFTLIGASIRYDDDSLAPRALDLAGGMQNMKRQDMAGMARMMIPAMAAQYVSPEFAQSVAEAVAKFVEDPKSLTIEAAPAQPVPLAMVAAGFAAAPKAVPEQLGITVTANED